MKHISHSKPFEALMEDANQANGKKFEFKFNKMLQSNNSRKDNRKQATGVAYFYDKNGDLLGKSELADVSSTGARVKTSDLELQPGSQVTVIIVSSGTQFDQIICTIRWIADVDVKLKCRQMGIEFATIAPAFKEKFTRFMGLKQVSA